MSNPTIKDLIDIARKAGDLIRIGFERENEIEMKGEIDLVTETDKRAEDLILSELFSRFPEHTIISEESENKILNLDNIWYVDPIDGTTNFAHKLPILSVSIAYLKNNKIQLGVVYNPISDEMFSAEMGKGAWLNNDLLKVSDTNELKRSLLVTGFPYDRFQNPDNNLDNFNKMALKVRGIRRLGSAALDLCSVAAGRVDGYWEIRLEPWDIAAGTLIARESGAVVTDRNGEENVLKSPYSIVAANPIMHKKILDVISTSG
jgi:myo-inositol-1(or 4)-monophosphatase